MSTFNVRARQPPGAIRDCKRATLGSLVSDKMQEFDRMRRDLPSLRSQLALLESELANAPPFTSLLSKEREASELRDRIRRIESGDNEMDYLFTITPILRAYGDDSDASLALPDDPNFVPTALSPASPPKPPPPASEPPRAKGTLNRKYLELVKVNESDILDRRADTCRGCGASFVVTSEGMVCPDCGSCHVFIESSFKNFPYREQRPMTFFAYKRINHFNEWLQRFQGKDRATIPESVFEQVRAEMKRMRLPPEDLTQARLRALLKKLGLNKYYEHVPRIFHAVTGQPLPRLSDAQEEKLRSMFLAMQEPFSRACPSDRKNFLSYSFVLLKLAELLQLNDILHSFSLLKSKEKLYVQERVWRAICDQLGWRYIRTI